MCHRPRALNQQLTQVIPTLSYPSSLGPDYVQGGSPPSLSWSSRSAASPRVGAVRRTPATRPPRVRRCPTASGWPGQSRIAHSRASWTACKSTGSPGRRWAAGKRRRTGHHGEGRRKRDLVALPLSTGETWSPNNESAQPSLKRFGKRATHSPCALVSMAPES